VGVAIVGGYLAIEGKITIGNIQSFIQYNKQFTQPINQIAEVSAMIQGMIAAAERIFEFLDEKEELETNKTGVTTEGLKGNVKFEHVKFGYRPEQTVIKDFNATVKGHPLCWHTGCAEWLLKYDNKTILEKQLARIYRDVGEFKGLIDMWDVINEVVIMPIYDKYDNAITRLCKEHGRIGLCKKVFDAAKDCNPNGTFLINDFNLSTSYEILIDGLLQSGVPINTIGLQSHQHHGVWGIEKLEETLTRFEHFGLPIHFTENTIVAGPNVDPKIIDLQDAHYDDDAATPELEQMQAEELSKMYKNLFEKHDKRF
jgi:hypothetical protein